MSRLSLMEEAKVTQVNCIDTIIPSHPLPSLLRQTFIIPVKCSTMPIQFHQEKKLTVLSFPTTHCFHVVSLTVKPSASSLSYPPGDGSNTNSSPEFSQAKFDMSSFIGGIILVLCVQAGGFFAMRFLKSKEQSTYDPM